MGQDSLYQAEAAIEKTALEVLHSVSRIISKHYKRAISQNCGPGQSRPPGEWPSCEGPGPSAEDEVRLSAVELSKVKGVSARPAKDEVKQWLQSPDPLSQGFLSG